MRVRVVMCLLACLLAVGSAVPAAAQGDASDASSADERYAVQGTDIAIAFPPDWAVEVEMTEREFEVPGEDGSTSAVPMWTVLDAYAPGASACRVYMFDDILLKMMSYEHANLYARRLGAVEGATVDVRGVELPVGAAARVDFHDPAEGSYATYYLFDVGLDRYELVCSDEEPSDDHWRHIADTIESTRDEAAQESTPAQRIELEDVGIAITFPPGWRVERESEVSQYQLPPEYMDPETFEIRTVTHQDLVRGSPPSGHGLSYCSLDVFEEMPMSPAQQAEVTVRRMSWEEDPQVVTIPVELSVGDGVRVDFEFGQGAYSEYAFDANGRRFSLTCTAAIRPEDDWSRIVEAIELLDAAPPDEAAVGQRVEIPATAVALTFPSGWDVEWQEEEGAIELPAEYAGAGPLLKRQWLRSVTDFSTIMLVADGDSLDGSVMSADCLWATWIEYEDGTYEERLECMLSDDPVDPPEWQGVRPTETVTVGGGECEWTSDFWFATDGSDVWASSYEFTITPDGRVVGGTTYGAELLDCSGG